MKRVAYYTSILIGSLAGIQVTTACYGQSAHNDHTRASTMNSQDQACVDDLEWDIEPIVVPDYRAESVALTPLQAYYAYIKIKAMRAALYVLTAWNYIQTQISRIF